MNLTRYLTSKWLGLYANHCAAHNGIMRDGDIVPAFIESTQH
jgi:hypothetical protein